MIKITLKLTAMIVMIALESGCLRPNPSDKTMETGFRDHIHDFEALKEMITHDTEVRAVFKTYTVPAFGVASRSGFSEGRWSAYRALLQSTGVAGVVKTPVGITFEVSVFGLGLHAIGSSPESVGCS